MTIVYSAQISEPKIKVYPPSWIWVIFWITFSTILFAIARLAIIDVAVKYILISVLCLVMFGILRNQLKGNYLVTLQANKNGLYFQTSDNNQYFYVPWKDVGIMEKTIFPLNSRGLRFEITGESANPILVTNHVGNVSRESGRIFVYTIPQLRNRDRLIEQFTSLKNRSS